MSMRQRRSPRWLGWRAAAALVSVLSPSAARAQKVLSLAQLNAQTTHQSNVSTSNWFNPSENYKHFMVPGLLVSLPSIIRFAHYGREYRAREGTRDD